MHVLPLSNIVNVSSNNNIQFMVSTKILMLFVMIRDAEVNDTLLTISFYS